MKEKFKNSCQKDIECTKDLYKKLQNKMHKGLGMKKHKERVGWEIVQLPNGDFQWIIRRGV